MVVLAKFLRKKRCPLSPNLRAAFSIPHRNFWACFIAFGVAKERDGERERGKEKHRKEEREKAEWILPSLLSFLFLLLLPVKQLLMICRQMVSGRSFLRLALLQTGGWEPGTMQVLCPLPLGGRKCFSLTYMQTCIGKSQLA